jgi:hypothetical protein
MHAASYLAWFKFLKESPLSSGGYSNGVWLRKEELVVFQ